MRSINPGMFHADVQSHKCSILLRIGIIIQSSGHVKSRGDALGVVEEVVGDGTVEGAGEGVEGAESRGVGAAFDTNEGYATDTGGVG